MKKTFYTETKEQSSGSQKPSISETKEKYFIIGISASAALLMFYFIVASLLGGAEFALDNFVALWYWMVPLSVGFGVQMGMFFYMRDAMHKAATASAAVSTGASATSMVACCAHHVSDIAPFLGIAALGIFFTKYQTAFLLIGLLSNALGIVYMSSIMGSRSIDKGRKIKSIFYALLVASIITVAASFYFLSEDGGSSPIQAAYKFPAAQTSSQNNVDFTVTPVSSSEFKVSINTHSVELDFDVTKIALLYDDLEDAYQPVSWEGSPPGGHHREGILSFPDINQQAKSIKLVISDHGNRREFAWDLR
ncbi:hypothetical protein HYV81_04445 [Candidatus Woesearchaeota archaeon]|nr:hypothetical protein [Candidatus Woesearchaeota archaeon]